MRSTAEQEEARRKERERKVLWYREKNNAIFTKVRHCVVRSDYLLTHCVSVLQVRETVRH